MRWSAVLVLWLVSALAASAQVPGSPFISSFEPEQYQGHPQNWAALQDARGVMLFGNTAGILEYDGVRWALTPVLGNSGVRSLALGLDGTVYYGSSADFGQLTADPAGRLKVVSLKDKIPAADQAFNEVWQILPTSRGVYFFTRSRVFRLHQGAIHAIQARQASSQGCVLADTAFFLDQERGLCALADDRAVPVPGCGKVYNRRRVCLAPSGPRRLLVGRMLEGWLDLDLEPFWDAATSRFDFGRQAEVAPAPFPCAFETFGSEQGSLLYKLYSLPDGTFALSTLKGGIGILDRRGKALRRINTHDGLLDDTVGDLYVDRERDLWAMTNAGLSHIEMGAPQQVLGPRHGLKGTAISAAWHKGRFYVGTYQVLQVCAPYDPARDERQQLVSLKDSPHEIWQFLQVGDDLLAATGRGLARVDGEKVMMADAAVVNAYTLACSRRFPDHLFLGLMDGLALFRRAPGSRAGWALVTRFKDIRDNLRSLVEDARGDLWASTDTTGLLRFRFNGDAPEQMEVQRFGPEAGLPGLENMRLSPHAGHLYVSTPKGIYLARANGEQVRFEPETTFGKPLLEPPVAISGITFGPDGAVWISSPRRRIVVRPGPGGAFTYDEKPFQGLQAPDTGFICDPAGGVWLPGKQFVHVSIPEHPAPAASFSTLVRRVASGGRTILYEGNHVDHGTFTTQQASPPTLPYRQNALEFQFAATCFEKPGTTEYQCLLEGFDRAWSDWSLETRKEYTNLPEGSYAFRVKARNVRGEEGREAVYRFRLQPPWYRSWWAYLLWFLGGSGLLTGSVLLYTARLRGQKLVLEGIVASRTEELRLAKEAAEQASEFKSRFIANTSHELRTPLNAILGFMRLLAGGGIREEDRLRFSRIVLGAGESLLQVVNDLLDLSRIEAGRLEVAREPFDLREVVEETLAILGQRAMEKGLELVGLVDPEVPSRLVGDRHRVRQMLINLVGNSLKFTPGGHIEVHVSGTPRTDGPWQVRVDVVDTGTGVPADVLPRLFTAFTQAEGHAKALGTGLGLAITRQLAVLMGGDVGVESEEGMGAHFWFTLSLEAAAPAPEDRPLAGQRVRVLVEHPALRAQVLGILARFGAEAGEADGDSWVADSLARLPDGPGLLLVDEPVRAPLPAGVRCLQRPFGEQGFLRCLQAEPERPAPEARPRARRRMQGRILVADDNPANRMLAEALLGQLGLDFVMVEDGQEAVERFRAEAFDLVILDGRMPRLDGPAALQALRELPRGREIPIILFSASMTLDKLQAARSLGFDDVLQKPADLDDFRSVVLRRLPQATQAEPVPGTLLDEERLERLWSALGGHDGVKDLLDAFRHDAPARLARMQEALRAEARDPLSREAHDFKSNAASMGIKPLAALASDLENHAPEASLAQLQAWVDQLARDYPSALAALNAWCAARSQGG